MVEDSNQERHTSEGLVGTLPNLCTMPRLPVPIAKYLCHSLFSVFELALSFSADNNDVFLFRCLFMPFT
jgi:hypothetical protein